MRFAARFRFVIAVACTFFFSASVFAQTMQVVPVPGQPATQGGPPQGMNVAPSVGGTLLQSPPLPGGKVQMGVGAPAVQFPVVPTIPGQAPATAMQVTPGAPSQQAVTGQQPVFPGQAPVMQAVPVPPAQPYYPGQQLPLTPGQMPPAGTAPSAASMVPVQPPVYGQLPPGVLPPATHLPGEEISPFEDYVSGRKSKDISFDIKQFGYDMFRLPQQQPLPTPVPGTMAQPQQITQPPAPIGAAQQVGIPQVGMPVQGLPVDTSYEVGPGDELRITVWGSIEGTWDVFVDRDGSITLPKVGVIGVTGMNFRQLKETLQKEFAKYYTDFEMNVSMGSLKSIRVYVVGNAKASGVYLVPSLTSVINALVTAGGPSKAGSLRDIQVRRGDKTVANLDVYELLLRGDRTGDIRLQAEDVIFIPPIGPIVGVAGSVERPAIYEMKGKTHLLDAIKMAGGAMADAYLHRVQVERVAHRSSRIMLDLDLQKVKGKDNILLQNGDIVKLFPAITTVTNKITLKGNVRRPGDYEWRQGVRVSDLIPSFQALSPDTLLEYALVERMVPPDNHLEYITFSLERAIRGSDPSDNICLQPYDTVTVFNKWEMAQKEKVRIAGAVQKPGDFEYRPNMKVADLIKLAGGLKRFAYTRTAELTRVTPTDTGPQTLQIDIQLAEALAGDSVCDIVLQEDDYLFVRNVPDWQVYRTVSISGEVNFPGDYPLKKGEKLSSLIERAGGYTNKAYLRGAVFTRQSVKDSQQKQLNEMVNRLERELLAMSSSEQSMTLDKSDAESLARQYKERRSFIESLRHIEPQGRMVVVLDAPSKMKSAPYDVEVEEGDTLTIPSNPNLVQVVGAVMASGNFVYEPKRDHMFYISKSGGFGKTADKKRIFIVKVDGTAIKPGTGGYYWEETNNVWQPGAGSQIEPGDVIIVPDELSKWEWLRGARDIAQILLPLTVLTRIVL